MTKREFDQYTKENWHGHRMASDERFAYRHYTRHAVVSRDYISDRAAEVARLRANRWTEREELPALGIGSPFRCPQARRARHGVKLLRLG